MLLTQIFRIRSCSDIDCLVDGHDFQDSFVIDTSHSHKIDGLRKRNDYGKSVQAGKMIIDMVHVQRTKTEPTMSPYPKKDPSLQWLCGESRLPRTHARLRPQSIPLVERSTISEVAARYAVINAMRLHFPVPTLCSVFGVSLSGYYASLVRQPSERAKQEKMLEVEIQAAHRRTRKTYGSERLREDLSDHGLKVGLHRIKAIRKKLGLRCIQKRRFRVTTDSSHSLAVADNILKIA